MIISASWVHTAFSGVVAGVAQLADSRTVRITAGSHKTGAGVVRVVSFKDRRSFFRLSIAAVTDTSADSEPVVVVAELVGGAVDRVKDS